MMHTHDLGTFTDFLWILSHLYISQTNKTQPKLRLRVTFQGYTSHKAAESRLKPRWLRSQRLFTLHPTTQLGFSPYPQPTSSIPLGGPNTTCLQARSSETHLFRCPSIAHCPSLPALRATPAQPGQGSYQAGVGGPSQSYWWSLQWAPRSPARSLRSRTTWRLRSGRPGPEPRSGLGLRGAGKDGVGTREGP